MQLQITRGHIPRLWTYSLLFWRYFNTRATRSVPFPLLIICDFILFFIGTSSQALPSSGKELPPYFRRKLKQNHITQRSFLFFSFIVSSHGNYGTNDLHSDRFPWTVWIFWCTLGIILWMLLHNRRFENNKNKYECYLS